MNLNNVKKDIKILFIAIILSIAVSIAVAITKLVVGLQQEYNKELLMNLLISSFLALFIKIIIYLPRLVKIYKMLKNKEEQDIIIFKKVYRINKILIIIYSIVLFSFCIHFSNHQLFWPIIITIIIILVDVVNLIYAKRVLSFFHI